MKCNVGGADRTLRITIGILILAVGFFYQSWWGAIGLIPLLTGLLRWCPAYLPIGFSTCKEEENKEGPR